MTIEKFVGLNLVRGTGGIYVAPSSVMAVYDNNDNTNGNKTCFVVLKHGESYEVLGDAYHIYQQIYAGSM